MRQAEDLVMDTEPSRLCAAAHSSTQIGVTAKPGSIKGNHPREFPGRTGFRGQLL